MKKKFAIILAICLALSMMLPSMAAEEKPETTMGRFPGASGGFNTAGVWIDGGQYFAQAFNTNHDFVGFFMTAWAAVDSSIDYALFAYRTDIETSIFDYDPEIEGTATFDKDNPQDYNVLFEDSDPVPAGKYVLVISVSAGRCGLNVYTGTDQTEFVCDPYMQIVDNYGMDFHPEEGDPTVMNGGLLFNGSDVTDGFRSIAEESLYTPEEPTAKPTTEPTPTPEATPESDPTAEATDKGGSEATAPAANTSAPANTASSGSTGADDSGDSSSTWIIIACAAAAVIAVVVIVIVVIKKKK